MEVKVTNEKGEDVTNRQPREAMHVYVCRGCGATIHGPATMSHHPVDNVQCGPLEFRGAMPSRGGV